MLCTGHRHWLHYNAHTLYSSSAVPQTTHCTETGLRQDTTAEQGGPPCVPLTKLQQHAAAAEHRSTERCLCRDQKGKASPASAELHYTTYKGHSVPRENEDITMRVQRRIASEDTTLRMRTPDPDIGEELLALPNHHLGGCGHAPCTQTGTEADATA